MEYSLGECLKVKGLEEVSFRFEDYPIENHCGLRLFKHEKLQMEDFSLSFFGYW